MDVKTIYDSFQKETKKMYIEYDRLQTPASLLNFVRAEARLNGFMTALEYVKKTKEIKEIIEDYKVGKSFNRS